MKFILIGIAIYWALKMLFGKKDGTLEDKPNKVLGQISLCFTILLIFGTLYFGSKKPGSFFERDEYEGMFYVYLYPNEQEVKSYRIPADIHAREKEYIIRDAQMPNGGKVTFYNSGWDSWRILKLNRIIKCSDDNGRYWGVQLTNIKVRDIQHPKRF